MQFHLCHVVPDSCQHGLLGYQEVIDTFQWGLTALGHEVTVAVNAAQSHRVNIIFGGQMFSEDSIQRLPAGTIFYNLEQQAATPLHELKPVLRAIARRFQVWDYNAKNIEIWEQMNPSHRPVLVSIGFAPILQRIPKRAVEDIDVLLYGLPAEARLAIFHNLCMSGMRCVFACGLYGASRDDLISRSKIVLNINRYTVSRVFEVVRVSYLLSNGKAVVSDIHAESSIDADLRQAVAFAPLEEIEKLCGDLILNDAARQHLAARGQAIFQRRDIRPIIQAALQSSGIG